MHDFTLKGSPLPSYSKSLLNEGSLSCDTFLQNVLKHLQQLPCHLYMRHLSSNLYSLFVTKQNCSCALGYKELTTSGTPASPSRIAMMTSYTARFYHSLRTNIHSLAPWDSENRIRSSSYALQYCSQVQDRLISRPQASHDASWRKCSLNNKTGWMWSITRPGHKLGIDDISSCLGPRRCASAPYFSLKNNYPWLLCHRLSAHTPDRQIRSSRPAPLLNE